MKNRASTFVSARAACAFHATLSFLVLSPTVAEESKTAERSNAAEASKAAPALDLSKGPEAISIVDRDGKPILVYRHTGVPKKPCVSELRTPAGIQVLRDAPADHLHHHALMFAVAVGGVDFWAEAPTSGKQVHEAFADGREWKGEIDGTSSAAFVDRLSWQDTDGKLFAKEERTIALHEGGLDSNVVTWQTRLEVPAGQASMTLTGSHYFGLGVRYLVSMDTGGRHFNAAAKEGEVVRGTEKVTPVLWTAFAAMADGKPVTVAVFDCPENPRSPATMFTMTEPFAYTSATLNLYREPLEVKAGKPLVLRYGIAAFDGSPDAAAVERTYRKWVALAGKVLDRTSGEAKAAK